VFTNALPPHLAVTAIQGMPMFAGALAVILGALVGGSEYGWGTVKTVLTQRPGRGTVLAGQLAGLAVVLLGLLLVTFAVDAGAAAVVAAATGAPPDFPGADELARAFLAGWLMVGAWSFAGLALGVATRGTSLAIGLGLVWLLVIENLVRGFASLIGVIEVLQGYLPGTNAGALVAALGGTPMGAANGTPGVTDVVGGTHAVLVLVAYVVVAVLGSTLLVRRRDVA
jgi:ABC-type transport system involved in multi-copper enzyme maturation permease subunit